MIAHEHMYRSYYFANKMSLLHVGSISDLNKSSPPRCQRQLLTQMDIGGELVGVHQRFGKSEPRRCQKDIFSEF